LDYQCSKDSSYSTILFYSVASTFSMNKVVFYAKNKLK